MSSNRPIIKQLDQLIVKAKQLNEENQNRAKKIQALEERLAILENELKNQKNHLEDFKQRNKMVNIASIVSNITEGEKKEAVKLISRQIKDIDQCIKLLKL